MSRYNTRRTLTKRQVFGRILFIAVIFLAMTALMPRPSQRVYQYRLGEPWEEEAVISEDSFPVLKTDAMLEHERDSLRRFYSPYFYKDEEVETKQQLALKANFDSLHHAKVPNYYLSHLLEKLAHVYALGIINNEDWERLQDSPSNSIHIYSQRTSGEVTLDEVFTEKVAYEYLMFEEDSTRFKHEMLVKCQLQRFLTPNLQFDKEKSDQQRQEVDDMLLPYMGKPVLVGQKIVDYGQIVDTYTFQALKSLEVIKAQKTQSEEEKWLYLGGQALFSLLIVLLLFFYFHQFRSDYVHSTRSVLLFTTLSLTFLFATYIIVQHQWNCIYAIPYCILPIFVRIFLDSRTAFIAHLFTILACAVCLNDAYDFVLIEVMAGLTAIYYMRQLSQRSELFRATVALTVSALLCRLCLDLIHERIDDWASLDMTPYIQLFASGCLTLIAYLLLIPIERIFGFTSAVTLMEMSNINSPLLRALSEKAPGTFQHSMQVSNLAAEAANAIGAQSQLVRTGALYHDIGKIPQAEFFTENQAAVNPHQNMTSIESATRIISHVEEGLRLAEKYQLPQVLRDFIRTHHGKGMARYFYITLQNQHPGQEIDPRPFTYPGPDPFTAEQAILMMADAVEAASRSLHEYTEESIAELVNRIVDAQLAEGRFKKCPISLRDIDDVKEVFCSKLKIIYHSRIQYPELKG